MFLHAHILIVRWETFGWAIIEMLGVIMFYSIMNCRIKTLYNCTVVEQKYVS